MFEGEASIYISYQAEISMLTCKPFLLLPDCSAGKDHNTVKFGMFPEHPFLEETFRGVGEQAPFGVLS